jgi:penicillin amidase
MHLLDPRFESWDAQLLSAVDALLERFGEEEGPLAQQTWGDRNTVLVRHPLSLAVPQLSRWLDIPPRPLPGSGHMPRVQNVRFGASMRMAVTPGREAEGLFHMPGGQSGHPRSPYYRAGHDAWAEGEPTPLLPGPAVHRLTLVGD